MSAASATCTQTISAGTSSAYWIAPTAPWAASSTAVSATGRRTSAAGVATAQQQHRRRRPLRRAASRFCACWWIAQSSVAPPFHSSRSIVSPVPAPPACGPAAVAAVPRKIDECAERQRGPHGPHRVAVELARALSGLIARAPRERRGGDEDQHREREMAHHEAGREVVADGEAAEHGLADDAERQQHAERGEVAAERPPPPGECARRDRGKPDEARDQAVAVLDPSVRLKRRRDAAVALGPVRTARARSRSGAPPHR